jgi:hypothetical protein
MQAFQKMQFKKVFVEFFNVYIFERPAFILIHQ